MTSEVHEQTADRLWAVAQRGLAGGMLVLTAPLMVALALAIRLDSAGPIIFRQQRPGWRGRPFTALKFRTMSVGAERHTRLGTSIEDRRITRIGRVLRATKLDELPQLWNIVRGDMRFVGPRPLPQALDQHLRKEIPGFETRYVVRPGLTSLAQVCVHDNGQDERLVPDWAMRFEAERRYIRNCCVTYDLIVILLTAAYVTRKAISR